MIVSWFICDGRFRVHAINAVGRRDLVWDAPSLDLRQLLWSKLLLLISQLERGNLGVLAFAREYPEPADASKKYTTTWFDMFRIVDGKIAEHWDPAVK